VSSLSDRQSAPRVVRHSGELIQLIRSRISELETTYSSVEALGDLQSNYLTKIIGDPPSKRIGLYMAFILLESLGLRLSVSIDPTFASRLAHRLEKRRLPRQASTTRARKDLPPDFRVHRSRKGGRARAQSLSAKQRSQIARNAVNARWRQYREVQQEAVRSG